MAFCEELRAWTLKGQSFSLPPLTCHILTMLRAHSRLELAGPLPTSAPVCESVLPCTFSERPSCICWLDICSQRERDAYPTLLHATVKAGNCLMTLNGNLLPNTAYPSRTAQRIIQSKSPHSKTLGMGMCAFHSFPLLCSRVEALPGKTLSGRYKAVTKDRQGKHLQSQFSALSSFIWTHSKLRKLNQTVPKTIRKMGKHKSDPAEQSNYGTFSKLIIVIKSPRWQYRRDASCFDSVLSLIHCYTTQ